MDPVEKIFQPPPPPTVPPPDKVCRATNKLKFLKDVVVKSMWRHRFAWLFQKPVDAKFWKLPEYYKVIKVPMDLGTIKKRLQNNYYYSADECLQDMQLMFDNCLLYNEEKSEVARMAHALKDFYKKKLETMPLEEIELLKGSTIAKGKVDDSTDSKTEDVASHTIKETKSTIENPEPDNFYKSPSRRMIRSRKNIKNETDSLSSADDIKLFPAQTLRKRRISLSESAKSVKRFKSDAVAMSDPVSKVNKKKGFKNLSACKKILRELFSKSYISFTGMFRKIDAAFLGLDDYYTIIKKPMDLDTIKLKLDHCTYKNASEFAADMRLIFKNCYTYLPTDHDIVSMARKMEDVFESLYYEMSIKESNGSGNEYMNSFNDSDAEIDENLEILEKNIKDLNMKINELRKLKSIKESKAENTNTGSINYEAKHSDYCDSMLNVKNPLTPINSNLLSQQKELQVGKEYEYKHVINEPTNYLKPIPQTEMIQMQLNINTLPREKLIALIQTIRDTDPAGYIICADGDIEIDLYKLRLTTLYYIQSYVRTERPAFTDENDDDSTSSSSDGEDSDDSFTSNDSSEVNDGSDESSSTSSSSN